jgi:alkylhydroperoxidase family enzyme
LPVVAATAILPAMQLTIHTNQTAPEASKPILEGIASDLGLVPNMAAAIASSPTLLSAFDGLRRAVGSGELDPRAREVAGVAVGVAVDNRYGVAFHSTVLGRLGVDEAEIERMRGGEPPHDEKLAAAYELARAIAVDRGAVADNVVSRAQAVGYSTADVLEIVTECTFAGLVGVMDNLAGRVTLDEFLAPRAWS